MTKLRDQMSSKDLQSLRVLRRWAEGDQMTAAQVREAAADVANFVEWIINAEVCDQKH